MRRHPTDLACKLYLAALAIVSEAMYHAPELEWHDEKTWCPSDQVRPGRPYRETITRRECRV